MATGTGLVIKLILEKVKNFRGKIFAIDPDESALMSAKRTIDQTFNVPGVVEWIKGKAEELSKLVPQHVDVVTCFNGIHNLPDKLSVLMQSFKILKPGGFAAFNSAFTQEAYPGSALAWGRWKFFAFQELGGKRDPAKPAQIEFLSVKDYCGLAREAGFSICDSQLRTVALEPDDLKAIAGYGPFIEGTFADLAGQENYKLEDLSWALTKAVDKLFASIKSSTIGRNWFELIAQKPA